VKVLVHKPDKKVYTLLQKCLKDTDPEVRFIAFDFLYNHEPAIVYQIDDMKGMKDTILFILSKKHVYNIQAARLCARLKITEAYPYLKKEFEPIIILRTDYDYQQEFLKAAIEIGNKTLVPDLVEILNSVPKPAILNILMGAFENNVKSEEGIKLLSKNIDFKATTFNDKWNVMTDSFSFSNSTTMEIKKRVYSAMAIGCIGGELAYITLIKGLDKHCSLVTRRGAVTGLAKLKDPRSTDVLIDCLDDNDKTLKELSAIALKSIGESITEKLLLKNNNSDSTFTEILIFVLAGFKNDAAQAFIEKFKNDPKYSKLIEEISLQSFDQEQSIEKVLSSKT
jgi:HEAT repeat protein